MQAIPNRIGVLALFLCIVCFSYAQPSLSNMNAAARSANYEGFRMELNMKTPTQAAVLFSDKLNVRQSEITGWLSGRLGLRANADALVIAGRPVDYNGVQIDKIQQYYKGVKVEHGIMKVTSKSSQVRTLQMEFYPISDSLEMRPAITEAQALQNIRAFLGNAVVEWDQPRSRKPVGELVIVEDRLMHPGTLVLAYKFEITTTRPYTRRYIYVNVADGSVVFTNSLIKHFNANGVAETMYSQTRNIVAGQFMNGASTTPQYRLRAAMNGDSIVTLNFGGRLEAAGEPFATDFTDNDNNWTLGEHQNASNDHVALDAHLGASLVSDYWQNVHGRNSWDNHGSRITSYVHVRELDDNSNPQLMDNAFWNGTAMYYGDGSFLSTGNANGYRPVVSMDVIGHELGHAICDSTAGLVYERESGALNEGFSDIWGACLEHYSGIGGSKITWKIGEEITATPGTGLRSMNDPRSMNLPDTYGDRANFWRQTTYEGCPVPGQKTNDYCGVHTNSSVLNKWFYLVTDGGSGTNGNGYSYNITGLGWDKSQKIAFCAEQNMTPNSNYATAKMASINACIVLGLSPAETQVVADAWRAVGVFADSLFNMANTPQFTTNSFTAIGVAKSGHIWAGTSNEGLYKYNGRFWQKTTALGNHNILDIKSDTSGGLWVAQSGSNVNTATGGGVNYFPDTTFNNTYYSQSDGLPNRNVKSLFIDQNMSGVSYPYARVWTANNAQYSSPFTTGAVGRGTNSIFSPRAFTKITEMVEVSNGNCSAIGGTLGEVWIFAASNFGKNQLLRYNMITGDTIGRFDQTNAPLPDGFIAKAIYGNPLSGFWIGLQSGGVYVYKNGTWKSVNFPTIFPGGALVNNNAITGDKAGNIYIGTSKGLVTYTTGKAIDAATSYQRFTVGDGLPSDNVKFVCVDTFTNRILLATDNGIAMRYPICPVCTAAPAGNATLGSGDWNDPAIWESGTVPTATTAVTIKHAVSVTANADCKSIYVNPAGSVRVKAGANLNIKN